MPRTVDSPWWAAPTILALLALLLFPAFVHAGQPPPAPPYQPSAEELAAAPATLMIDGKKFTVSVYAVEYPARTVETSLSYQVNVIATARHLQDGDAAGTLVPTGAWSTDGKLLCRSPTADHSPGRAVKAVSSGPRAMIVALRDAAGQNHLVRVEAFVITTE